MASGARINFIIKLDRYWKYLRIGFQFGELIKLLANVLGMLDENLRPDRGSFIYINNSNIDSSNRPNLQPVPGYVMASVYDFASVTHAHSKVCLTQSLLRPRYSGAKYCDGHVCMSVCSHLKNHASKFHAIFCTCQLHGSVLLWEQCNTLFTSGFVYDVTFSHNRPGKGDSDRAWHIRSDPRTKSDVDDCIAFWFWFAQRCIIIANLWQRRWLKITLKSNVK